MLTQQCNRYGTTFSFSGARPGSARSASTGEGRQRNAGRLQAGGWYTTTNFPDVHFGLTATGAPVSLASHLSVFPLNRRDCKSRRYEPQSPRAAHDLSTDIAFNMAQAAVQTSKQQGYNVSAHVVGRDGQVLVAMRGDNTGPHTLENSFKKAYTAFCAAAAIGRIREGGAGQPGCGRAAARSRPRPGRVVD